MIATRSNPTSRLARQHAAVAGPFRRGVTLVLVVMLLVLLQVAVAGTVTSSARQVDLMTVGYQGAAANYRAEGLLQRGIREAVRNTDEDGNGTIGTVGAAMGSSLTRTTSGSDSILTGTVAVGDVTRSLQYRWTVVQPVVASGMPLAEFFTVAFGPSNLAAFGWSGTPAATGAAADINFALVNNTPMWRGGPTGRHGTRITGSLSITLPGTYIFNVESDDGSDFAINGSTLINNDGLHGMSGRSGTTVLAAGTYPFVARMFENSGGSGFRLYWQAPGATSLTLIPPRVMTGSGPSRGVTAHSWLSLRSNSQITAWARSGLAGGRAVVTNATTNNGSSAGIDLRNQALLLGDVQVGVGGALGTVLKLSGSSSWTGTGSALSVPAAVERVSMPVVPGTTLGSVSLTNSATASYGPGTVRCASLSMAGDSVVTINGETVLIVDFTLSMANQARIQLAPGASLRLYVGSGVWMAGTAQINGTSSRSPDVRLYITNIGTPTFTMGDSTLFCGNVQNPNGTIAMFSDSVFYGTMEANNVTLEQQARIFADVSASSGGSSIASATLVYFSDLTLPN